MEKLKLILKVDSTGGGIKDFSEQLHNLDSTFFIKSYGLKKESKHSVILYQVGNSSRRLLFDFLINNQSKRVIELHDLLARNKLLRLVYPYILKPFLKKADVIILHSQHAKSFFENIYGVKFSNKILIIPHLVFNLRARKMVLSEKTIFLIAGQIKKSKGVFVIMEAFSRLPEKYTNSSSLVIAGDVKKELLDEIKNYHIKNLILIDKRLSENELNNLIYSSDFVFNFKTEDLGESSGIVARAIALRKPLICSNIGSNKEFFSDSCLLSDINVEHLKELLITILKNEKIITKKELELSDKLRKTLSGKAILDKYKSIWAR